MTNTDAAQYAAEWASKTGKNVSEIYIPLALRDPEPARPADADEAPEFINPQDSWPGAEVPSA